MRKLSSAQQAMLDQIEAGPFKPKGAGPIRTAQSLMNRGLVEADVEERLYKPAHEHRFHRTMHLDGCHFFTDALVCSCGVTASIYHERDYKPEGSMAIVWMDSETCQRCQQLLNDSQPMRRVSIVRPSKYRAPKPEPTPPTEDA